MVKVIGSRLNNRTQAANKLRSKAGETISETLVALLIAALALVMLAGAIYSAKNIIDNSRTKFSEYYSANENLVTLDEAASTGSAQISIKETGSQDTAGFVVTVDTYTNSELKDSVITYKLQ